MPRTTRKAKGKSRVLKVDSAKKIPMFNSLIKNGSITFVLVYADWCGACTRFKKNIWNPMCQGPARHQRAMIDSEMIKNTNLANAEFEYLPSIILVDENGSMQSFKKPDGSNTNAMPTPQSLNEMKKAVNVPVVSYSNSNSNSNNITSIKPLVEENTGPSNMTAAPAEALPAEALPLEIEPLTIEVKKSVVNRVATPAGPAYIPTPMVSPQLVNQKQKGGSLSEVLPSAVLGGLAMLLRGNRKSKRKSKSKSKRSRKSNSKN